MMLHIEDKISAAMDGTAVSTCGRYSFVSERPHNTNKTMNTTPRHIPTRSRNLIRLVGVFIVAAVAMLSSLVMTTGMALAAPASQVNISLGNGQSTQQSSTAVTLLVLFTVLAVAPSILIMTTGFTRILIVLGFLRNALGTPQMPPNQVLIGISMFLTVFVMFPTFSAVNETALQPFTNNEISQKQAIDRAQIPVREFMFKQVKEKDLSLFVNLSKIEKPQTRADVPTYVLIPAFLISELKTAFQIGFLIFIPFLIIDMVVASTLMSMGMIMLPPVMISMPFKILLFVLVDGWSLTIDAIVRGFGVT